MVNKSIKKVKATFATVAEKPYFADTLAECTAVLSAKDPVSKLPIKQIPILESPTENCWRLVHDGVKVISLFECSGLTWTRNILFCAKTEEECLKEIERLKLDDSILKNTIINDNPVGKIGT